MTGVIKANANANCPTASGEVCFARITMRAHWLPAFTRLPAKVQTKFRRMLTDLGHFKGPPLLAIPITYHQVEGEISIPR
jgi:hypothetical protein